MIRDKKLSRNFQTIRRRFNGMGVNDIGYFPRKTEHFDCAFASFNYSIILSGTGSYSFENETIEINSPCVLTQFPGERAIYGPSPGQSWEEIYFILPPEKVAWIIEKRLLGDNRFYWPIRNPVAVVGAIRALLAILENSSPLTGKADLVDHLSERVIMESLLPGEPNLDPGSNAVSGLEQAMIASPEKNYDYREVARDHGISFSTFQRRWRERHEVPPAQYLLNLRISESCRLMAETDMKITEISRLMGFEDPAYYSRIFKQRIGMPPTHYRAIRRPELS